MARSRRLQQRLESQANEASSEDELAQTPDGQVYDDDGYAAEYNDDLDNADIPEGAEDFDAQVMSYDEATEQEADADDGATAHDSARSSSRSSARSSHAGRSARSKKADQSKRASARKKKAPVDLAARRASRQSALAAFLVILIIVVLGGGGYAGWHFFLRAESITHTLPACPIDNRPEQEVEWTRAQLAEWYHRRASEHLGRAQQAVRNDDHEAATAHIQQCRELYLNVEFLNFAQPNPSEENELIGRLDLAESAHSMMVALDQQEALATNIRNRKHATRHFNDLRSRMHRLTDIQTIEGLDEIERHAQAFMRNPVDPQGVDDPQMAEAFSILIDQIDTLMPRINAERTQRDRRETTVVVNRARTEIKSFTDTHQFGKALSHIDTLIPQWPRAELRPLRQEIINAANQHFESAMSQARNAFDRAEDPASTQADVHASYNEGVKTLRMILDNYNRGIQQPAPELRRFITQAEEMLRRYQR